LLFPEHPTAFDQDNRLVLMDGVRLRRLDGVVLETVAGGDQFSQGSIGFDRDGALLIGSQLNGSLARLTSQVVFLPAVGTVFEAPVGAPSGNYFVHVTFNGTTQIHVPSSGVWTASTLDMSRTFYAPDGTLYAIANGDVNRVTATDTFEVVASCAEFGGATCGTAELVGTDENGHLMLADAGARSVQFLDPATGAYRVVEMPGELAIFAGRACVHGSVVVARDPNLADQRSLWVLRPGSDAFERVVTLITDGGAIRVLADRSGELHLIANEQLTRIVVRE
jgi:hypothetical protein